MVVMKPRSMPNESSRTLEIGARQLVVQEALEITSCFFGSYFSWLMPKARVKSWPLAGAEMITFLAPAAMCFCASTRAVNRPEHSSTMSQPCCLCGSSEGSRFAVTAIFLPLTTMASSSASTLPSKIPCTESYLKRCARVFGLSMSVMGTTSKLAPRLMAARRMLRPMRPKPLIANRAMKPPFRRGYIGSAISSVKQRKRRADPSSASLACSMFNVRTTTLGDANANAFLALALEILRHELDELGGEREQLPRGVTVLAKLSVEASGQDPGRRCAVSGYPGRFFRLRDESIGHGVPRRWPARRCALQPFCRLSESRHYAPLRGILQAAARRSANAAARLPLNTAQRISHRNVSRLLAGRAGH